MDINIRAKGPFPNAEAKVTISYFTLLSKSPLFLIAQPIECAAHLHLALNNCYAKVLPGNIGGYLWKAKLYRQVYFRPREPLRRDIVYFKGEMQTIKWREALWNVTRAA